MVTLPATGPSIPITQRSASRSVFGVTFSASVPGVPGALVVSDKVTINPEIEAVLQS